MKIAIVGGSGFIGRNLAKALHRAGEEVIIFSRKNSLPQELMGLANIHLVSTSKPSAKDLEGVDALVNPVLMPAHKIPWLSSGFQRFL